MSSRTDADLLSDIREAIRRIQAYLGTISYEAFLDDTKTQDAIIRNIEIIGEAAKGISEQLREDTPQIPWQAWQECGIASSIIISALTLISYGRWFPVNCQKSLRLLPTLQIKLIVVEVNGRFPNS